MLTCKRITFAARLAVSAVLLLAALGKALAFQGTMARLAEILPLSYVLAGTLAAGLIALEFSVAVLLQIPSCRRISIRVAGALTAFFTATTVAMLAAGRRADCGCFGRLFGMPLWLALLADLSLVAACAGVIVVEAGCATPERHAQERGADLQEGKLESRVSAMLTSCLACVVVLASLAPQDPYLYQMFVARWHPHPSGISGQWVAHLCAKDPPTGSVLPLPLTRMAGAATRRVTVVLMVGACAACTMPWLRDMEDMAGTRAGVRAVVITTTSGRDLVRFRLRYPLHLELVSDPQGLLARRYNAAWFPRAYVLGPGGVLKWCQKEPRPDFHVIGKVLDAGGES